MNNLEACGFAALVGLAGLLGTGLLLLLFSGLVVFFRQHPVISLAGFVVFVSFAIYGFRVWKSL